MKKVKRTILVQFPKFYCMIAYQSHRGNQFMSGNNMYYMNSNRCMVSQNMPEMDMYDHGGTIFVRGANKDMDFTIMNIEPKARRFFVSMIKGYHKLWKENA